MPPFNMRAVGVGPYQWNPRDGSPGGRLLRATNHLSQLMDTSSVRFEGRYQVHQYGSTFSAMFISWLAERFSNVANGHQLRITNVSDQNGHKKCSGGGNNCTRGMHASHANGLDIDLAYPDMGNNMVRGYPLVEDQTVKQRRLRALWNLAQLLFESGAVAMVFIDHRILRALNAYARDHNLAESEEVLNTTLRKFQRAGGHADHLHVRLQCTFYDQCEVQRSR